MDANQRAAILGTAASMNEGEEANEAYKTSWAGLQDQIEIGKGRLERLAGEVLLPVLIPAMQLATRVMDWLGDTISATMDGPLGGLISVIGSVAAGFALAIPAIMAIKAGLVSAKNYVTAVETKFMLNEEKGLKRLTYKSEEVKDVIDGKGPTNGIMSIA